MKKFTRIITMLLLAAALSAARIAFAEPGDTLKGIFEALTAEGSDYSKTKAYYLEYFPGTVYGETLDDHGFTITITGNEYVDGSWTFTEDGDYLTTSFGSDDFAGAIRTSEVVQAVGTYFGMNSSLLNGYINGLSTLNIKNDYFIMENDETGEITNVRINIAGPYDMKELDQMVIDEASFSFDPLTSEHSSMAAFIGKIKVLVNGSADNAVILLAEYGSLDDLALTSVRNVVSIMKPAGWENFTAEYTELADAEGNGYSVKLNADREAVDEIIEDASDDDSFMIVRFGE